MNLQIMRYYLNRKMPFYMEALHKMVTTNSYTMNKDGVNSLGHMISELFGSMGFKAEFFAHSNPDFGNHLILARHGYSQHTIALIGHLDTVYSSEEENDNNFSWREIGDRIYGPGSIDIKGGIIMIYMVLDVIRTFAPKVYNAVTWVIGLDSAEEVDGSHFGKICLNNLNKNTLACLVFEVGYQNNNTFPVVVERKGKAVFHLDVTGRGAHAGVDHDRGANAIVQLAQIIEKIANWTNYERELTFNIGVVNGGKLVNRVPYSAFAKIEMRAYDESVFNLAFDQIMALNNFTSVSSPFDDYPCRVLIKLEDRMPPWPCNLKTNVLLRFWKNAADSLGYKVSAEKRGGLSDGNYLWNLFPTLDGLGPDGANDHCSQHADDGSKEQEYVSRPSFIPKALLNSLAIIQLAEQHLI